MAAVEKREDIEAAGDRAGDRAGELNGNEEVRPENFIQVSTERQPIFYAMLARRLMTGKAGKAPHSFVIISGLGTAIKTAIGAAGCLERGGTGIIRKVETSMYESSKGIKKKLPKIHIVVERGEGLTVPGTDQEEEERGNDLKAEGNSSGEQE